ncbi:nicotinate (nicotinamide) nucleotide adenylyltransferase [bacterium]|nr:MAG: nicotinate (nicotinamide) nucleotide adenylyltransferase [bacterium]
MSRVSIGLFGGTFDPIHNGHISLIESFLQSGIIQEIWVIPTFSSPHRETESISPFRKRLEMARIALKDYKQVSVSDIEYKLPRPSYSFQTMGEFQKLFPFYDLYWCLGGDQLQSFHKWVLYDAILAMGKLLVAERPGFDKTDIEESILDRTIFVEHQPIAISSTEIKEEIKKGLLNEVPLSDSVKEFIRENKLYGL